MASPPLFALITAMAFAAALGEVKAAAAAAAPGGAAAKLTCSDAVSALIPCGSYLLGSGGNSPSKECCLSAQKLNSAAGTKADREALCECLEQMGPSFGVKPQYAKLLPVYCNLQLKIPISTTANCSLV